MLVGLVLPMSSVTSVDELAWGMLRIGVWDSSRVN